MLCELLESTLIYIIIIIIIIIILAILACLHIVIISNRSLHQVLRELNLYQRRNQSDMLEVPLLVESQLTQSGCLHGYPWMHAICIKAGFIVPREDEHILLQILDPRGVSICAARRLRQREYKWSQLCMAF